MLKPGGRLLVVDMLPHDREDYRQQMGHVWLGFSDEHMRGMLGAADSTSPDRPAAAGRRSERARLVRRNSDEEATTGTTAANGAERLANAS